MNAAEKLTMTAAGPFRAARPCMWCCAIKLVVAATLIVATCAVSAVATATFIERFAP